VGSIEIIRLGVDDVPAQMAATMAAKLNALMLLGVRADMIAGGPPGNGRGIIKTADFWAAMNVTGADYETTLAELYAYEIEHGLLDPPPGAPD